MRRREFITLLGGTAAAWPLAARAQGDRVRRIGVLYNLAADDLEGQARLAAFLQGLQQLGWTVGRNLQIDTRWAAADAERFRRYAAELVANTVWAKENYDQFKKLQSQEPEKSAQ
jgi:putative ABC transport system substrate-binding protein